MVTSARDLAAEVAAVPRGVVALLMLGVLVAPASDWRGPTILRPESDLFGTRLNPGEDGGEDMARASEGEDHDDDGDEGHDDD